MPISIQSATIEDREKIQAFYLSCSYSGVVGSLDAVLVAKEGARIGGRLLDELQKRIRGRACYCVPYSHLENFYGKIGFVRIDESRAPAHLKDRAGQYRTLGKDVIIMRREAGPYVF